MKKNKIILNIFLFNFVFYLSSNCSFAESPLVKEYLDESIEIMKKNSINRDKIDWDFFSQKIHTHADKAITLNDAHFSIVFALSLLEDGHSVFLPIDQVMLFSDAAEEPTSLIDGKIISNSIAYLRIPYFPSSSVKAMTEYSDRIQSFIQNLDNEIDGVQKWIIDLRANGGGNMWPMLLGVSSLLQNFKGIGSFVYADGKMQNWHFEDRAVFFDKTSVCIASSELYKLRNPQQTIALLIDSGTASAAEALAIAFCGRDNARFFGQKTGGYTTGNAVFKLNDGAALALTVCYLADHTGKIYPDGIIPDVVINELPIDGNSDIILEAAIQWLNYQ